MDLIAARTDLEQAAEHLHDRRAVMEVHPDPAYGHLAGNIECALECIAAAQRTVERLIAAE